MDDTLLQVCVGERYIEMEAASLKGVGNFARVVARQENDRWFSFRFYRPDFGYRYLILGQDLK